MDLVAIVNWIAANLALVVALTFGLVVGVIALLDWLKINTQLRDLFLMAEKYLADHIIASGPEAMQVVVESLYDIMPRRVRGILKLVALSLGVSEKEALARFAQWVYDRIKSAYANEQGLLDNALYIRFRKA